MKWLDKLIQKQDAAKAAKQHKQKKARSADKANRLNHALKQPKKKK